MPSTSNRLEIYNMALGFIGSRTVGSPNERTPEAIQCELFWDRARRSALRDYPYRFAVRRMRLPEMELPEVYAGEWCHAYGVPDTVLRVLRVHQGRERGSRRPFSLEQIDAGPIILCNIEQAMATCIVDVEDISRWDDAFIQCIARKLAYMIAVPLLKDHSKVQALAQQYQACIPQGEGVDGAESVDRREPDAWLMARGRW